MWLCVVDNAILQIILSDNTATIDATITPLKQKKYVSDNISDIMKDNMATFLGKEIANL